MVESGDNLWRGPMTLNADIAVTFQGAAGEQIVPTIIPTFQSASGGTVSAVTSTPGLAGIGSVAGVNGVQTVTFSGAFDFSATTTSGSALVTGIASTVALSAGMPVSGPGIPNGATILSITSGTSVTLNVATTVTGTATLIFGGFSVTPTTITSTSAATTTTNSATVGGFSSTDQLFAGMTVTGVGIPANTTIVSINDGAGTITLSNPVAVGGAPTLTFTLQSASNVFTLVVSNGTTSLETNYIAWTPNLDTLIARIQAALNGMSRDGITPMESLFGGTTFASVAKVNPLINVFPNSRLTVAGSIGDGAYPTDISVIGGGELNLAGANTYRGTTFVNQGILTIQNTQALGGGPISQVQTLTLGTAGSPMSIGTQYTLSFNGYTTPVLTYTESINDVTVVTNALNALSSIGALQGLVPTVLVDFTIPSQPVFTITLAGALSGFEQPLVTASVPYATSILTDGEGGTVVANNAQVQMQGAISVTGEPIILQGTGSGLETEEQRVSVSGPIYGSFQLTFTNPTPSSGTVTSTTVSLPIGASATLVQNALNALPAIQDGIGAGGGGVSVTETGLNAYTILFQEASGAASPGFFGASQPWSQQLVNINGTNTQTLNLNFTGFTPSTTLTLPATPGTAGEQHPWLRRLQTAITTLLANSTSARQRRRHRGQRRADCRQGQRSQLCRHRRRLLRALLQSRRSGSPAAARACGATATATVNGAGVVTAVTVVTPGSGYFSAPTVTILGGTTNAVVTASLGTTSFLVTFGGALATVSVPLLHVTPITASATVANNPWLVVSPSEQTLSVTSPTGVIGFILTSGGSGYAPLSRPTVRITGGGGTGRAGTATVNASGVVTNVTILTPGSGYIAAPTITVLGGTVNAVVTAVLGDGTFTQNVPASFNLTAQTVTIGNQQTPQGEAATQASLQTAINALLTEAVGTPPGGGAGTATVDLSSTGTFLVTFGGSLAGVNNVPLLTAGVFTFANAVLRPCTSIGEDGSGGRIGAGGQAATSYSLRSGSLSGPVPRHERRGTKS